MRRVGQFSLYLAGSVGLVASALAQDPVMDMAPAGPSFYYAPSANTAPVRLDVKRTPVLSRRITLDMRDVTLEAALEEIRRQAGLKLMYSSRLIPLEKKVSIKAEDITVASALGEVLFAEEVDVVFSASAQAMLVPRSVATAAIKLVGIVSGRVTDSTSGEGIAAVTVMVEGTQLRATTGADGSYSLRDVPAGTQTLVARRLGYARKAQSVNVVDNSTTSADFALARVATTLDDAVSTATGDQRRMEIGSAIATLNADEIARTAPIASLTELLTNRVTGVAVLGASGQVGTGPRIRIRGLGSISESNDPIVILDGVRINSAPGDVMRLVGGHAATPAYPTPSRLNDINIQDLESIEIVKGPSATTLYGTDAGNGVIVIQTKRGATGPPRWRFYSEGGISTLSSGFPDNYFSWGRFPNGTVGQCVPRRSLAGQCTIDSLTHANQLNNERTSPFGHGARRVFGVQVSGGSDHIKYMLGVANETNVGPLKLPAADARMLTANKGGLGNAVRRPNRLDRLNFSSRLNLQLTPLADLSLSSLVISNEQSSAQEGGGFLVSALNGAGYADTLDGGWGIGGLSPRYEFSTRSIEDVKRSINSVVANWQPVRWLRLSATAGIDDTQGSNLQLTRAGDALTTRTDTGGYYANWLRRTSVYSGDFRAVALHSLGARFTLRSAGGLQFARTVQEATFQFGSELSPGAETLNGALFTSVGQGNNTTAVAGVYLEEMLGIQNRLFVTGALRGDGGNGFGDDYHIAIYPKASLSWVIREGPGPLRARFAYGESGIQASPLHSRRLFTIGAAGSGDPGFVDGRLVNLTKLAEIGNTNLKPERQREVETGVDASLFGERVEVVATYFAKVTRDAIMQRALPTSLGGGFQYYNVGSIQNRGIEAVVTTKLVSSERTSWHATISGTTTKNKVLRLNGDSLTFAFGLSPSFRGYVGYPLHGAWARPYTFADSNSNGIIEPNEVKIGAKPVYVGPTAPTRMVTLGNEVSLRGGAVRMNALLSYQGGNKLLNNLAYIRCKNFYTGGAILSGQECNDPRASLSDQARAVAAQEITQQPTPPGWIPDRDLPNAGYFEPGAFYRLRELSLVVRLPGRVLKLAKADHGEVSIMGRNLAVWTRYRGPDPEANSSPGTIDSPLDGGTVPSTRQWTLRVNLGY